MMTSPEIQSDKFESESDPEYESCHPIEPQKQRLYTGVRSG